MKLITIILSVAFLYSCNHDQNSSSSKQNTGTEMPIVTGIGGIFFKARNPKQLTNWYADNFKLKFINNSSIIEYGDVNSDNGKGHAVLAIFNDSSRYFETSQFMINFRVRNLEQILSEFKSKGIRVEEKIETLDYGKFGWIYDPEGNKIELWEPIDSKFIFEKASADTLNH